MKIITKLYYTCGMLLVLSLLSGCISTYTKSMSQEQVAKQFQPNQQKSKVYIFRSQGFASSVLVPIWVDGVAVAQTSARSFLVLDVEPGQHTIVSKTPTESSVSIFTESGGLYFIWQELKVGVFSPRSSLHQVSEEKGKNQVLRCSLLKGYL